MGRGIRIVGWGTWIGLLLLLAFPLSQVALSAPSVLDDLRAAVEGDDEEAMRRALRGVPGFYAATKDTKARESVREALDNLLGMKDLRTAQLAALQAITVIGDADAFWEMLSGRLPQGNEVSVSDVEIAVIRTVGALAPAEAVNRLLTLATGAETDEAAVESMFALRGYAGRGPIADEIMREIMTFVREEAGAPARKKSASPQRPSEQWEIVASATLATLRALSGRDLDLRGFRELWEEARIRDGASLRSHRVAAARLTDPDPEVVLAALEELFDGCAFGELVRLAIEGIVHKVRDWRATAMALRLLAFQDAMGPPPSTVLSRAGAKRWQVRLALAEGLAGYQDREAVVALIGLLGDRTPRVRDAAARSLAGLTGRDFGMSQKRWSAWLRKQKDEIRFVPRRHRLEVKEGRSSRYAGKPGNTFFGAKITSKRVVLVLDKSHSMYSNLFAKVVEEVAAFLDGALPTTWFGLVEFDTVIRRWRDRLVPVNASTANGAVEWLQRSSPDRATNIIDALRSGFTIPKVECIALLSDGMPNRGEPSSPREILAAVRRLNRHERLVIHTLLMLYGRCFAHDYPREKGYPPLTEAERVRRQYRRDMAARTPLGKFMKALAKQNDGTFFVVFADYNAAPPGASGGSGPPSPDR